MNFTLSGATSLIAARYCGMNSRSWSIQCRSGTEMSSVPPENETAWVRPAIDCPQTSGQRTTGTDAGSVFFNHSAATARRGGASGSMETLSLAERGGDQSKAAVEEDAPLAVCLARLAARSRLRSAA